MEFRHSWQKISHLKTYFIITHFSYSVIKNYISLITLQISTFSHLNHCVVLSLALRLAHLKSENWAPFRFERLFDTSKQIKITLIDWNPHRSVVEAMNSCDPFFSLPLRFPAAEVHIRATPANTWSSTCEYRFKMANVIYHNTIY